MNPPFVGVLMLETRFPRLPGDVGLAGSFAMPVRHRVVAGASPRRVVLEGDPDLLQPFIDAARRLVDDGARAITTSCGFLVRFQAELQAALPVPVWTSALLLLPELDAPGVVTVDAASLSPELLRAAGAGPATPVHGLPAGGHLQTVLLQDLPELDAPRAQAETVAAAQALVAAHPHIRHIVLECTNLPPYAAAVAAATGRPVHHLMTLVHERWNALP